MAAPEQIGQLKNNPSKKVLLFLPFLTYGGAERQGFLLAKGLQEGGSYQVTVCGFKLKDEKYPLINDLEQAGIAWHVLPFDMSVMPGRKSMLSALWSFIRYVRAQQFSAVIPFTFWPNYLTAHASRFVGAQCYWNQRSVDDHVALHGLEKWMPLNKLTFVSNSTPGTDFLVRRFKLQAQQVSLIPNSVIPVAPRNNADYWRTQLRLSDNAVVITMVANFYPEKDFDTVINAAAILKKSSNSYRFVFAGGGPDKQRAKHYKAMCYDLGLSGTVTFLDNINDVPGLLQVTDIGLLSSRSEGCPNSVLEYMYNALPVVVNDIVAITDVVGTDYAYLFKTGDEEGLVQAIEKLSADKQLRKNTGEALKERVTEKYNQQKMVAAYIQLLEKHNRS